MTLSEQRNNSKLQSAIIKIERRIQEILAVANETYDLALSPEVSFKIKGRTIARAGWNRLSETTTLEFNAEAVQKGFDHVLENTVPHEVAHLVCGLKPELGYGHCKGWAKVCEELGGNGKRQSASFGLSAGRKTRKFAYIATCGTTVTLSAVRHNKIHRGATFTLASTGGRLNSSCSWEQIN